MNECQKLNWNYQWDSLIDLQSGFKTTWWFQLIGPAKDKIYPLFNLPYTEKVTWGGSSHDMLHESSRDNHDLSFHWPSGLKTGS